MIPSGIPFPFYVCVSLFKDCFVMWSWKFLPKMWIKHWCCLVLWGCVVFCRDAAAVMPGCASMWTTWNKHTAKDRSVNPMRHPRQLWLVVHSFIHFLLSPRQGYVGTQSLFHLPMDEGGAHPGHVTSKSQGWQNTIHTYGLQRKCNTDFVLIILMLFVEINQTVMGQYEHATHSNISVHIGEYVAMESTDT